MSQPITQQQSILEAALFASTVPLTVDRLSALFPEDACPTAAEIKADLQTLAASYEGRGVELVEVATGYRFQAQQQWSPWLSRLWEKKPPRYSRALLETLALIVYRQPITRAEIEDVRGVVVSSTIIRTLLDREWIKEAGYRDTPGKPALFATTKQFLDDFNVTSLADLPTLKASLDLDEVETVLSEQLHLSMDASQAVEKAQQAGGTASESSDSADDQQHTALWSQQPVVITPSVSDEAIDAVLAQADEKLAAIDAARETWVVSDDELPQQSVDQSESEHPCVEIQTADPDTVSLEQETTSPEASLETSETVVEHSNAVAKEPAELV